MSETKSSWVPTAFIVFLIAVIVGAFLYGYQQAKTSKNKDETQDTAQTETVNKYKYELANDESTKQDQLSEESVNLGRLRKRFLAKQQAAKHATLDTEINNVITQNPDVIFGVSIIDLNSSSNYDYGNKASMTAASVTKVLTAVYYLKQVELGNRSLDTMMANGYSAEYNIEQMIVVSNNEAWHLLNENLGYQAMQDYAHSIGLDSYDYANNKISSADTAQLFGDLYKRTLINEMNTQLLLSYMERANYRDLIIPAVPSGNTVYHKAGEYLVNLNDAAIITNGTRTVVLSIYTESTAGYDKARVSKLMQQITTPVVNTFNLN